MHTIRHTRPPRQAQARIREKFEHYQYPTRTACSWWRRDLLRLAREIIAQAPLESWEPRRGGEKATGRPHSPPRRIDFQKRAAPLTLRSSPCPDFDMSSHPKWQPRPQPWTGSGHGACARGREPRPARGGSSPGEPEKKNFAMRSDWATRRPVGLQRFPARPPTSFQESWPR